MPSNSRSQWSLAIATWLKWPSPLSGAVSTRTGWPASAVPFASPSQPLTFVRLPWAPHFELCITTCGNTTTRIVFVRLTRTRFPPRVIVSQTVILRRSIRGWQRSDDLRMSPLLHAHHLVMTADVDHGAGTLTRSRTRWQSIASTSFENPIPLTVGRRMLRFQVAQFDQP